MVETNSLLNLIPFTTLTTKVGDVMDFISTHDFSHFIIFNENFEWIANIPTQSFYDHDKNDRIEDLMYSARNFHLESDDDLSVIIDTCSKYQTNVVPIISKNQLIIDIVSSEIITAAINKSHFLKDDGSTIIIEHDIDKISFAKIAQVVETNNAKLLGILTLAIVGNRMQMLLRTNQINTITILNDFRRFGFDILSKNSDDNYQSKLIDNSNYLNKFLNL